MRKILAVIAAATAAALLLPGPTAVAGGGKPGTIKSFTAGWSDSTHTAVFVDLQYAGSPKVVAQAVLSQGGPGVYETGSLNTTTMCTDQWSEVRQHQLVTALSTSTCGTRTGSYYMTVITRTYDRVSGGWAAYSWRVSDPLTP